MVSIKGVKGFVPLLENIGTSPQQRHFKTEKGKIASAAACSRYHNTDNGRRKIYEANQRYNNKPYYCASCNMHLLIKSKYLHLKSQRHLKNI